MSDDPQDVATIDDACLRPLVLGGGDHELGVGPTMPRLTKAFYRTMRASKAPTFVENEMAGPLRYGRKLSVTAGATVATLSYRIASEEFLEGDGLKQRACFAWITLDKKRVGALEIRQYKSTQLLEDDEFLDTMDSESELQGDLATVLLRGWSNVAPNLLAFGDIIEFRSAWTTPCLCPSGLWASAAKALVETHWPDHSVLVLKAFPLEHAGDQIGVAESDSLRKSRQDAMRRHYARLLGVAPFPTDRDWMYRINPQYVGMIPHPKASRARRKLPISNYRQGVR